MVEGGLSGWLHRGRYSAHNGCAFYCQLRQLSCQSTLGGAGTLATLAMVPIVSIGAHSGRSTLSPGLVGWRIASWITYGLSMANAVGLIGEFLAGYSASIFFMVFDTALGSFSLLAMALEASATYSQAVGSTRSSNSISIMPHLQVVCSDSGYSIRPGLLFSIPI